MNYLREINSFRLYLKTNPIPATAQALWYVLIDFHNSCGWERWITIDNLRLQAELMISKPTLHQHRLTLIQMGFLAIEYYYNGQAPQWSHPLIGKTVSRIGLREMFESENMGILMAQFIRVYNNYREEEREESLNAQILRLAGIDRLMLTEKEKQYGSH
jgi:hypothetical protein